jgi:hypothetical protein
MDPGADRAGSRRQRGIENAIMLAHASAVRGIRSEDEQAAHCGRPPSEALSRHRRREASLLIELAQRGFDGHQLRLVLDDEKGSGARMPREDID